MNFSTNVYVSYRSGNSQKFWANVAIATAGVAISTQLSSTLVTAGDSKTQSAISPIVPLGVTVATLPSIWKNRPRGVPQAGLWIQHRNIKGELLETWEQPISNEAKNSAELLTVVVDKPLSEGTLEVYLQNGSKNEVYYWGVQTVKNIAIDNGQVAKTVLPKPRKPVINDYGDCPGNLVSDGLGNCVVQVESGEVPGVTVTAPTTPYYPSNPFNNLQTVLPSGDPNGGGNGNSNSDPIKKIICTNIYNQWANGVESVKTVFKENVHQCIPGVSKVDLFGAFATWKEGGMGAWSALAYSFSLFDKVDEMYNCLRAADATKGSSLDRLWDDYQRDSATFHCQ